MNYTLFVPDGKPEITLGLPFGSVTLKNGQIVPGSVITQTYPHMFKPIEEEIKITNPEIKVVKEIAVSEEPKRKAGRPKKTF